MDTDSTEQNQTNHLIFTHGYLKKTDKTSPVEIVRAKRMRDYHEDFEPPPHIGIV
jgi:hypothetical protein